MKHTARNTDLLRTIKKLFNDKIYKHALRLYNEQGEAATLAYMATYTKRDLTRYTWE